MKKYNRIVIFIFIIFVIASIPALVSAVYVPSNDDNKPDYYYVDHGENVIGDLEDVIADDSDAMSIDSVRYSFDHYVQIRYYFYYDHHGIDSEGISIDFYVDESSDSNVKIHAYGGEDGWMYLGEHTEGGYNLLLDDYNFEDQVISVIKFSKTKRWDDFVLNVDLVILDFVL